MISSYLLENHIFSSDLWGIGVASPQGDCPHFYFYFADFGNKFRFYGRFKPFKMVLTPKPEFSVFS
ncbi:MAG: hypothetical protein LBG84_04150 [Treponema sp.]|jgi:hypothetical protein|nr:hypothetical protein [Treponema sp.]